MPIILILWLLAAGTTWVWAQGISGNTQGIAGVPNSTAFGSISVTGSATVGTGVTVTAGGLTVTAGGLTISAGGATVTGGLTAANSGVLSGAATGGLLGTGTVNATRYYMNGAPLGQVLTASNTGIVQNTPTFVAIGATGTSQTTANYSPLAGTFKNLQFTVDHAPGAGQGYTITLVSGLLGNMTSSIASPSCIITATATTCSDTLNAVASIANVYWALQVNETAGAVPSDHTTFGLEFDPQ